MVDHKTHISAAAEATQRSALAGPWEVWPVPRGADPQAIEVTEQAVRSIPARAHLQTVLFPDNPYWGRHLREINDQDWLYRQTFALPNVPFRRARLHCEGIDYFASVYINGQLVGQHEGAFAPFTLDVSESIRRGAENALLIRVSAPWDPPTPRGAYPLDHVLRGLVKGLYEHGEGVIPPDVHPLGIWRPVWIVLDDGVGLDRARIRTSLDGSVDLRLTVGNTMGARWQGTLRLEVTAENHAGPGAALSILVEVPPGESHIDQQLRIPDPQLWWPWDQGAPNLYRLTASLRGADGQILSSHTETFGLRTVELERSSERFTYRINGRPVFLRGTSYIPGLYLSQCDREWLRRDLDFARGANLNLLRVHVHVSPPELYDLCDRAGMLIWQDFELNWVHDPSPAFEARARALQREMFALLGNHPSVITWTCHNEPTMIFSRRENLEQRPDPALYRDAIELDPTRPVFYCSGQMEADWRRAGDTHTYYGALWTRHYTDVYRHRFRLNTEFGFEAPAAVETLRRYPIAWERLKHLEGQIPDMWAYQAALTQFHVEHLRRLRAVGCAGYVHFWLADLAPQVGCGVLDSERQAKSGYDALRLASQPLQVALEHDGHRPRAIWVFNDTPAAQPGVEVRWRVTDRDGKIVLEESAKHDITESASQRVAETRWSIPPAACTRIDLELAGPDGAILATNSYHMPFAVRERPRGYPWKFDPVLGCKVFDRPGAPSLVDLNANRLFKLIPLRVRENSAEWIMRQKLPLWLLSIIGRLAWLVS